MTPQGVFEILIDQLMQLPSVGRKTGERYAFSILKMSPESAKGIAQAIVDAKEKLFFCKICRNMAEHETCKICLNEGRDHQKILVVEETSTLCAIEKTGEYKGRYHVLHGTYSPISDDSRGGDAMHTLIERVKRERDYGLDEVILATSPNMDGEATALYLTRALRPLGVKVTRIACGIPAGSDIAYADEVTLMKSLEGRREIYA